MGGVGSRRNARAGCRSKFDGGFFAYVVLHEGGAAVAAGDLNAGDFVVFGSWVVEIDGAEDVGFVRIVGGDGA